MWPDDDPGALRAAWLIAAMTVKDWRSMLEAGANAVKRRPPTHWRSGVRLVEVIER